jgi:hypothetical protein
VGKGGRKVNMIQKRVHMYVQCKNDTFIETIPGTGDREVEEVSSSMIYLIHHKNFCKCYHIPPSSTTAPKIIKEKHKN